jgi:hypothetical protein
MTTEIGGERMIGRRIAGRARVPRFMHDPASKPRTQEVEGVVREAGFSRGSWTFLVVNDEGAMHTVPQYAARLVATEEVFGG